MEKVPSTFRSFNKEKNNSDKLPQRYNIVTVSQNDSYSQVYE